MQIIEIIKKNIKEGRSRFTFELLPPLKGDGTAGILEAIDTLAEYDPAYINITNKRGVVKYIEREGGLLERRIYLH